VTATDADLRGDTLTYSISGGADAAKFAINSSTGALRFALAPDFETPTDVGTDNVYDVTVQVSDGTLTDTQAIAVTVTPLNDAPVNAVPSSQTVNEDSPLVFSSAGGNSIAVSDVDLNGGMIGVRLVATNGVLTLASTTGLTFANGDGTSDPSMVFAGTIGDVNAALDGLTFDPTADYNGPATVRIDSRDMGSSGSGGEQIDDDTINITVDPVNDAPVAADDDYSIDEDNTLTVSVVSGLLANDADIDLDVLTVVPVTGTANGSLSLNANESFVYTPDANFNGVDSFTYRATDGSLRSSIRTVTLTVNSVNDAPVSNDESFVMDQLTVLNLNAADGVLINDLDVEFDALTAVLVDSPNNGTLVLNADGSFSYTPSATFFGEDTFTYRSNDGSLNGTIATVRIVVQQTVTSGTGGDDGGTTDDGTTDTNTSTDTGTTDEGTTDTNTSTDTGTTDEGTDASTGTTDSVLPGFAGTRTEGTGTESDSTTDSATDSQEESQSGTQDGESTYVVAWRVDDHGDLRDRFAGYIVEDAGNIAFTSTNVGSMVHVLEQSGFWTELDNFEQDVKDSAIEQNAWEDLVVETTTVAGTTLTVGYIVWLLRSGSIVFGLVSSLPAWTLMDPLPILESGVLAGLTDVDDSDDDSLQGILKKYQDATGPSEQSFEY
jgi:VCBS repeat-containing protein